MSLFIEKELDVAVIGAGFSGLAAADQLSQQGRRVTVFESAEHIGGRSKAGVLNGHVIDLGGQWVGAGHSRLEALTARFGKSLVPQFTSGKKLFRLAGKTRSYKGTLPVLSLLTLLHMQLGLSRLGRQAKSAPLSFSNLNKNLLEKDNISVEEWARKAFPSEQARALFNIGFEAVLCRTQAQTSLLWFLHYVRNSGSFEYLIESTGGAQANKVQGGMWSLAESLVNEGCFNTAISEQVLELFADQDTVRLVTTKDTYKARQVIVAMSPHAGSKIKISPEPTDRLDLARGMPMGSVIKCLIAYKTPFWREQGFSGEIASTDHPFSPIFDASPVDKSFGALIGFFDAEAAKQFVGDDSRRRSEVINTLVEFFGEKAQSPIDYVDYDWTSDPWSEGCYVGVAKPGVLGQFGNALRAKHHNIYWAGTETANEFCGYIEGALESGYRAAQEVLADY